MMANDELVMLEEVTGSAQAEALRGLLEAQGVQVVLSRESAGQSTLPVTFGILGSVQLLVRKTDESQARQILEEYYAGAFIEEEQPEEPQDEEEL